ncbi:MAG: hypothetical protein RLZZ350_672 [Verrucomicrobiota bacterium]|jgi:hypothetical protein
MRQIAGEDAAVREKEARAYERQKTVERVKKASYALVFIGLVAAAYIYRDKLMEVQKAASEKITANKAPIIDGKTTAQLNELEQQAAKRDGAVEDILATTKPTNAAAASLKNLQTQMGKRDAVLDSLTTPKK